MTVCLTNEVRELLGENLENNQSASLRLDKYVDIGRQGSQSSKTNEIKAVVQCHNSNPMRKFAFVHPKTEKIRMKLCGRLIVNQAGGVLENAGICLHRHWSYPLIPGSAIKGCCRHYAWELWRDADSDADRQNIAHNMAMAFGFPTMDESLDGYLAEVFPKEYGTWTDARGKAQEGTKVQSKGCVAFLDAHPYSDARLVSEITTCHHKDYYNGSQPKGLDNEEPNPQAFPTVDAGVVFLFQLLPLHTGGVACSDTLLQWVKEQLMAALQCNGIGGKTAAGYGWFEEDPSFKKELEAQAEAEERQRLKEEADKKRKETEKKAQEEAERKRQAFISTPFADYGNERWKDFSSHVKGIYTEITEVNKQEGFTAERKQELYDVILQNPRIKPKDLEGGRKSLDNWFSKNEELINRLIEAKKNQPK